MKLGKILNLSILIIFLNGFFPTIFVSSEASIQNYNTSAHLISSDLHHVLFELVTGSYLIETVETQSGIFDALRVTGYGNTDQVGLPQLPFTSVLLGIPESAEVRVSVVKDDIAIINNMDNLIPVPIPAYLNNDNQEISWVYEQNPAIYNQGNLYPANPIKIEEYGWLRNQRFVKIGLYPFQYNPSEGDILWHKHLIVEVTFNNVPDQGNDYNSILTIGNENDSSFERLISKQILNYDTAQAWRKFPSDVAVHQTTMAGDRIRIVVEKDGVYRIDYDELINLGLAGTDPRTYQMTNQGSEVAILVSGEEDGVLTIEDYVLFWGEEFRGDAMAEWYKDESVQWITYTQQLPDGTTIPWHPEFTADMMEKYTSENVYWLQIAENGVTPLRISIVDGTPGIAELVPPTYRTTARVEKQLRHWEYHFTSEDTWFWDAIRDGNLRTYPVNLSALSPELHTVVVRGEYVAFYNNIYTTPDHVVNCYLNGGATPIGVSSWDGRSRYHLEVEVPSSTLIEGENQLGLTITYDSLSPYLFIDWFEIDYERNYVAEEDQISFSQEIIGTWRYQLRGFSQADILIFDVTNPRQPYQITNFATSQVGDAYQVEYQYLNGASVRFFATNFAAIRTPKSISLYTPPDIRSSSNGADYLIITHHEFIDTAQGLADYRAGQGMRARVVDLQDLYNEFNEGIQHPIAIKNFLKYTFTQWTPPAPMYVVLAGDGHWDMLGAYIGTEPMTMLPNLSWVDPAQGEVDSSNSLATIIGDDPLPDIFIGRIPINSDQEFQNVIDKIIHYEQLLTSPWQLNNTFIADNTPDAVGDFVSMANDIIERYIEPGYTPIRIFLDEYQDDGICGTSPYLGGPACPAVNAAIVDTLNNPGSLFVTYIGHAATQRWAHEQIFLYHADDPTNPNDMYYNDIDQLTNDDQLPIVLSMDCLDGYWFYPVLSVYQPSLAELLIRTPGSGAVATFSPTGLAVGLGHNSLMDGFFKTIYQDGLWELGAAVLGAKIELYSDGIFSDMIQTYTIFGDPALRIPNSYSLSINPSAVELHGLPGSEATYTIQVTNTGTLPDVYELKLDGNAWVTTLSTSSVILDSGDMFEITVSVNIPEGVSPGMSDMVDIWVNSSGDLAQEAVVTLRTMAIAMVHLPFLRK